MLYILNKNLFYLFVKFCILYVNNVWMKEIYFFLGGGGGGRGRFRVLLLFRLFRLGGGGGGFRRGFILL